MSNTAVIIIGSILALALIIFLIWKNNKDKKLINPDADEAVIEALVDNDSRDEKIWFAFSEFLSANQHWVNDVLLIFNQQAIE